MASLNAFCQLYGGWSRHDRRNSAILEYPVAVEDLLFDRLHCHPLAASYVGQCCQLLQTSSVVADARRNCSYGCLTTAWFLWLSFVQGLSTTKPRVDRSD